MVVGFICIKWNFLEGVSHKIINFMSPELVMNSFKANSLLVVFSIKQRY